MKSARSWEHAFLLCAYLGQIKVEIPKSTEPELPDQFRQSKLAFDKDAVDSYRDQFSSTSHHVREYTDRWVVHIDKYNPKTNPLKHAVTDVASYITRKILR